MFDEGFDLGFVEGDDLAEESPAIVFEILCIKDQIVFIGISGCRAQKGLLGKRSSRNIKLYHGFRDLQKTDI
jgi:hypothetical protein